MQDEVKFAQTEAVIRPEQLPSPVASAHLEGIQPAPREAEHVPPNKVPPFVRWGLLVLAGVFGLYFGAALLGLVPSSFVRASVGGRKILVLSYSSGVIVKTTPETVTVESGRQRVIVRGDVVDLGDGRTLRIPAWCVSLRISMSDRGASITLHPE